MSALAALGGLIRSLFTAAWNGAKAAVTSIGEAIVGFARALPGRVGSALSSIKGAVLGAFAGAGSWLLQAGRDVLAGLANGIGQAVGSVVAKAKEVAGQVVAGVKAGLGIGSPSKVMRDEVGRWIPPASPKASAGHCRSSTARPPACSAAWPSAAPVDRAVRVFTAGLSAAAPTPYAGGPAPGPGLTIHGDVYTTTSTSSPRRSPQAAGHQRPSSIAALAAVG